MNFVKSGCEAVWVHVKANPGTTATQAILVPLTAFGGPTVLPVLGWVGFSATGPVAGSAAAWFQSTYGVNAVFSALQSAPMGGYAATAVTGGTQAAYAAGIGIAEYFKAR